MPSPKDKLATEFFEFDFFQAVRVLEKLAPKRAPVGLDGAPGEEVARFRAHLSMAFPPSQIVALDPAGEERSNPLLTVTFLGLYGPSGVLPTHYTQLLMDIQRDVRGPERRSLRDWLDLFNHRFISLFYRAWEKYRFHLQYERGEAFRRDADTFTLGLRSVMGFGTQGIHTGSVHARKPRARPGMGRREGRTADAGANRRLALLHYAGFSPRRETRPTFAPLADYFRLPSKCGSSRAVARDSRERPTRLGEFGALGVDAIAGEPRGMCSRLACASGRSTPS